MIIFASTLPLPPSAKVNQTLLLLPKKAKVYRRKTAWYREITTAPTTTHTTGRDPRNSCPSDS